MTMRFTFGRRAALCASAVLAIPSSVASAQGRALRAEDFYAISTISTPAISPNGRWVAYTLTSRVEATNADPTEVWLVGADGAAAPVKVSPDGVSAARPRWERDGALSFTSGTRRWTLDPSAPQARTEGEVPREGRETRYPAPVGGTVAILRPVPPPPAAPSTLSDFERRHEERFKGRQFDWLNFQRDGQAYPLPNASDPAVSPPQELFLAAPGEPERQLTRLGLRPQGVAWSADGRRLVFVADSAYRDERKYGSSAVFVVTTDGAVRNITPDRDYEHRGATFSPDGRWVLYTRQLSRDVVIARKLDHGGATDLAVRPADGGAERVLTADWDLLPANASWSPDGKWVYFTGGIGGATHLFRVSSSGGAVQQVTQGSAASPGSPSTAPTHGSRIRLGASRRRPSCTRRASTARWSGS